LVCRVVSELTHNNKRLVDIKLKISDGSGAQLKNCYLFVKVLAKLCLGGDSYNLLEISSDQTRTS
jgi:hypothetical protein